jgi:hypothetical protein
MTDWHEDSAARSRRFRGEKTVEQRLADLESEMARVNRALAASGYDYRVGQDGKIDPAEFAQSVHRRFPTAIARLSDHDPLGR